MHAILHIGHSQSEIALLQQFLAQNWVTLIEHGVLYPSVEAEGVAQNLRMLLDTGPAPTQPSPAPHAALAHALWSEASDNAHDRPADFCGLPPASEMLRSLKAQIEQLAPETLVLCAAEFSLAGQFGAAAIEPLKTLLSSCDITLYCSLQRPDLHLTSWHQARIAAGQKLDDLATTTRQHYLQSVHFDYVKLLSPWRNAFPNAKIILRTLDSSLPAGDVMRDFAQHSKMPLPADLSLPTKTHAPAAPLSESELRRRAYRLSDSPQTRALFDRALASTQARHSLPEDHDIDLFGPELRAQMLAAFAPIHDQLHQLAPAKSTLFSDLEDMAQPRPISAAQAARLTLKALRRCHWPLFQPRPLRRLLRDLKRDLAT